MKTIESLAEERGVTVKEMLIWLLQKGGSPEGAARLFQIDPQEVKQTAETYNIEMISEKQE